jgi:hypothetical protein
MPFALDSNPTVSELSEAINYLLGNFGANLSADANTGEVKGPTGNVIAYLYKYLSVKYADSADGALNFSNSPTNRFYFGLRNTNDTVESTNPADYIWKQVAGGFGTTKFLFYQTNGGRQVNIIVDTAAPDATYIQEAGPAIDLDIITTVTGSKADSLVIYQWSTTTPATPSGASTYTWSSGTWSFTPVGWTISAGSSPGAGFSLYTATVVLVDSVLAATTTFNWSSANLAVAGGAGAAGPAGNSSRICYAKTTATSLSPTPLTITTVGNTSFPPFNTWGGSETWGATSPVITAGESVYQSDGVYDSVTNLTTWNVPYLSTLKVGQLSAISANLGTVTAGDITGTANINIAGYAVVNGNFTVLSNAASGHFNSSLSAPNGVVAYASSGGAAVSGTNYGSGDGVQGTATGSGTGVEGSSFTGRAFTGSNISSTNFTGYFFNGSSGGGVWASCATGTGLKVDGNMTINNTNLVSNLNAEYFGGARAVAYVNNGSSGTLPTAFPPVTLPFNQVRYLQINVGGVTGYIPIYI